MSDRRGNPGVHFRPAARGVGKRVGVTTVEVTLAARRDEIDHGIGSPGVDTVTLNMVVTARVFAEQLTAVWARCHGAITMMVQQVGTRASAVGRVPALFSARPVMGGGGGGAHR